MNLMSLIAQKLDVELNEIFKVHSQTIGGDPLVYTMQIDLNTFLQLDYDSGAWITPDAFIINNILNGNLPITKIIQHEKAAKAFKTIAYYIRNCAGQKCTACKTCVFYKHDNEDTDTCCIRTLDHTPYKYKNQSCFSTIDARLDELKNK